MMITSGMRLSTLFFKWFNWFSGGNGSIIFSFVPDHNPHVVEHIPHPARRFTSLTSCPHQHDSGIMEVINLRVLFLPVCWGYNGNGAVQGDAICRCTHAGHLTMIIFHTA